MKSFTVAANDAGQRMDKFIGKVAPRLPKSLLYKSIRTKNIKLNGKRAEISSKLAVGDIVSVYLPDEFFEPLSPKYDFLSAGTALDIVYEDENILLANKPQGLLSHPDKNEYGDTLIGRIQRYLYEKGEYLPEEENSFKPALANRIDRNTGGIVIAAKNAAALRTLCQKIKDREIDKRYLACARLVGNLNGETSVGEFFHDFTFFLSQQSRGDSVKRLSCKNNLTSHASLCRSKVLYNGRTGNRLVHRQVIARNQKASSKQECEYIFHLFHKIFF